MSCIALTSLHVSCVPVLPQMRLVPNCGSDRAWVWHTPADYSDEESKKETLAIRFASAEREWLTLQNDGFFFVLCLCYMYYS